MDDTELDNMTDEERAVMEQWESMEGNDDDEGVGDIMPDFDEVEDDAGGGGEADTRILNQDEIDSLLGFDDDVGDGETSGVMALINSAMVNYERLPMLSLIHI